MTGPHENALRQLCTAKGLNYVGTRGPVGSPLCIVGEAPGANEDQAGTPFVGASGQELDRMLRDAGIDLSTPWFTNPYKVRPPDNDLDRIAELGIPEDYFINQFLEELNAHKPQIIIACGATPLSILVPNTLSKRDGTPRIAQWRGSLLHSPLLGWPHYVIPMYHPAFILREWSERQIAVFCLGRAKEELDHLLQNGKLKPLLERQLIVEAPFDDAYAYLHDTLHDPDKEARVSIDIEKLRLAEKLVGPDGKKPKSKKREWSHQPYVVGFARSAVSALSLSLWDYEADKLVKLWRLIDLILRTRPQIGQNYLSYDCHWLESLGFGVAPDLVEDTLLRHHVLWPELEHKLQFQTFQYTREPYYKDEGREWKLKEGKRSLMVYNAKDAAVTYEVWERQEEEFAGDKAHLRDFYKNYEQKLGAVFYAIEKRGVRVDPLRLEDVRNEISVELRRSEQAIAAHTGKLACTGAEEQKRLEKAGGPGTKAFNINSGVQVIAELKALGIKVPKVRGTSKESSDEETLNKLFAETSHPILKEILRTRELGKMLGTYVNAKLADDILYTSYVVTGTVTGRRSARANVFGLGTNHQNLPKHSDLGKKFRRSLVARPGRIFVACDQIQAEDWVVQGLIADLSGHRVGIEELLNGVDRHKKLAAFIFAKPESDCGKDTVERFLGKKTRHAGNYDMGPFRFAQVLAKEWMPVPEKHCEYLLEKFHSFDPYIRSVFHKYIQDELTKTRKLRNLFGREREFFSLRPFSDNRKIFKEAYSDIPQGTVGDNTGLAILYTEEHQPGIVLMDTHDAVVTEVEDSDEAVCQTVKTLADSFDREIVFPNGLRLKIPIEVEIGYDLQNMKKVTEVRYPEGDTRGSYQNLGLMSIVPGLRKQLKAPTVIIGGAPLQSSPPLLSVESGASVTLT